MQLWQAVLLGIVEGISEFLPISSTGHLILTSHLLGIKPSSFLTTFEIAIQSGAILAVLILAGKKLFTSKTLIRNVCLSFIPAAVLGFLLYRPIKQYLLGNIWITVYALIGGGIFFLLLELWLKKYQHKTNTAEQLTPLQSILIGIGQTISIIPGVSRSAATMFSGILVGLTRQQAVEYSFLLAVPTIFSASIFDLYKTSPEFTSNEIVLLCVGIVSSAVSSFFTVRWLLSYINKHTFKIFAIYRIILGIIFALFFL